MIRPTLLVLNPAEHNYYSFMNSLDKYNGSCNVVDDLCTNMYVPSETKYINVKVFNIIPRSNELKTLVKHVYEFMRLSMQIL